MTVAPPTIVAAFDVDGTLTTHDSVVPFLKLFARRPLVLGRALAQLPAVAVALATRDRDRLRAAATRAVFTGVRFADVEAAGQLFAEELAAGRLRADTPGRLRWHVEQGHRVVLVSASYDVYLHGLAAALGAEAVLSTRLSVGDGVCTGLLDGANCRGPEKVARLHAWLAEQGLTRADITLWAYGDSNGDRELLAEADHPVWVNEPLATIAAA